MSNPIISLSPRQEEMASCTHFSAMVSQAIQLFTLNNAHVRNYTIQPAYAKIYFATPHDYQNAAEVYHHSDCDLAIHCNHKARLEEKKSTIEFFNHSNLGYRIQTRYWDRHELSDEVFSLTCVHSTIEALRQKEEEERAHLSRENRIQYEIEPVEFLNNNIVEW